MNNKIILNVLLAIVFALIMGRDSIISFSFSHFEYNPMIMLPLFSIIFFILVKVELIWVNKYLNDKTTKLLVIFSLFLIIIQFFTLGYIVKMDTNELNGFSSFAEQGNYQNELFSSISFYSILTLSILWVIISSMKEKKFSFSEFRKALIGSTLLIGNYLITMVVTPIVTTIFLLISL